MKNFEIPANEIKLLTKPQVFEMEKEPINSDDIDDGVSDIFPATFKIAATLVRSYFTSKNIPIKKLVAFNSEGDSDDEEFPTFCKLISDLWGFGNRRKPLFNPKSADLYFEYGWSDKYYTYVYEATINGKPALIFDVSDATNSTLFSMLDIIFAR